MRLGENQGGEVAAKRAIGQREGPRRKPGGTPLTFPAIQSLALQALPRAPSCRCSLRSLAVLTQHQRPCCQGHHGLPPILGGQVPVSPAPPQVVFSSPLPCLFPFDLPTSTQWRCLQKAFLPLLNEPETRAPQPRGAEQSLSTPHSPQLWFLLLWFPPTSPT